MPLVEAFVLFNEESEIEKSTIESVVPKVERTKLIALLVEDVLLKGELREKIGAYAEDAGKSIGAQSIIIPIPKEAEVLDIWEGLSQFYFSGKDNDGRSQLVGTVLVGNVPLPVVDKNGALWPTIYPYTDFEDPVYIWDLEKERFVYQGSQTFEPEIWHGVIRSEATELAAQKQEISNYLDKNHKVHTGETTYGKKVFYMDLEKQKKVVSPFSVFKYTQWVKYAEEIFYGRKTKN